MESMLTKIIRILLGLLLLFAGLNKFLRFAPNPPHPEAATAFMVGAGRHRLHVPADRDSSNPLRRAFVAGRFVALAAVVLAPVAVNIVLFHADARPRRRRPRLLRRRRHRLPARRQPPEVPGHADAALSTLEFAAGPMFLSSVPSADFPPLTAVQ